MITKKRMRLLARVVTAPFAWGIITTVQEGRKKPYDELRFLVSIITLIIGLVVSIANITKYQYFLIPAEQYGVIGGSLELLIVSQLIFAIIWNFGLVLGKAFQKFQIWWKDVPEDVVYKEKEKKYKRLSTGYRAMADTPEQPVDIIDEAVYHNGNSG